MRTRKINYSQSDYLQRFVYFRMKKSLRVRETFEVALILGSSYFEKFSIH